MASELLRLTVLHTAAGGSLILVCSLAGSTVHQGRWKTKIRLRPAISVLWLDNVTRKGGALSLLKLCTEDNSCISKQRPENDRHNEAWPTTLGVNCPGRRERERLCSWTLSWWPYWVCLPPNSRPLPLFLNLKAHGSRNVVTLYLPEEELLITLWLNKCI